MPLVCSPILLDRLKPTHFVQMFDAVPGKSHLITQLALDWARDFRMEVDPNHPFFEIFSHLEDGAMIERIRKTVKADGDEDRFSVQSVKEMLLALQELARPDQQALLAKLNNHLGRNELNGDLVGGYRNPAYQYLYNFFRFPIHENNDFVVNEGNEELRRFSYAVEGVWKLYSQAKANERLPEFYGFGFSRGNICFEARTNDLDRLNHRFLLEDPDFALKPSVTLYQKVVNHIELFKNQQIMQFCLEKNRGVDPAYVRKNQYIDFKIDWADAQRIPEERRSPNIQEFSRNYLNQERCVAYLRAADFSEYQHFGQPQLDRQFQRVAEELI